MKSISNCIVCGTPLSGKQRSFCSIECKNDHYLSYKALKERANERKARLIGADGSCSRCGYSASLDALSFYDERGQTLHIDTNVLANSRFEKLEKKLKHAQVLCRNCVEELNSDAVPVPSPVSRDDIAKKFAENLRLIGITPGQTIVLGVSGGVDSVTMLDLFAKSGLNPNIVVAHMNHGMRPDAINDERLTKRLTSIYGFAFTEKTLNYSHIRKNMRIVNPEEYFRNERREFLRSVARKHHAEFVALAHNANDQVETFIMNAVRGSGPAGLGAMNMSDGQIIRPLLNVSRAEIECYARENKLAWNEDETNKDIRYDRNYIRHRILPLLARLNPEYLANIGRSTHLQRQIDEHFKEEAYRAMGDTSCGHLRRLDKPLLYEVLGLLYEEAKGDRQNLALSHLTGIESLIKSKHGTKSIDLPGNMIARRSYDMLEICAKKEHNNSPTPSTKKLRIGTQKFGNWRVAVFPLVIPAKAGIQEAKRLDPWLTTRNDSLIIDAEILPNLIVRIRKPGDKIALTNGKGHKKLQDLFVDAKIDKGKRAAWPVVEDTKTNEIIWVPQLTKAANVTQTKNLLTIKIEEVANETTKNK